MNACSEKIDNTYTSKRKTPDLSSIVAHEIKSPLARMEFELEHLKSISSDKETIQSINSLINDVNDIEELTNDILVNSSLDVNSAQFEPRTINGNEFVNELAFNFRNSKKCKFKLSVDASSSMISINQKSFSRVITNLVNNAIKYGDSKVLISTAINDGKFFIFVEDDGLGVPLHLQEKIFKPFFRSNNHATNNISGFGLGLSIARNIVEKHEGKLSVENSTLGGAKFIVSLSYSNYQLLNLFE